MIGYLESLGIPCFRMPNTVMTNMKHLSTQQLRFLWFFHRETQKHQQTEMGFTAEQIHAATGIHPQTLEKVRSGLVELNMLRVRKVANRYFYGVVEAGLVEVGL